MTYRKLSGLFLFIMESQLLSQLSSWKNSPRLLPEDPNKRAKVRFWISYVNQQQIFETMLEVAKIDGETQKKAVKELLEKLHVLEEGMKEFFPNSNPCIDDENIGLLDIVIFSLFGSLEAHEEVLGINIIHPEKNSTDIPMADCNKAGAFSKRVSSSSSYDGGTA